MKAQFDHKVIPSFQLWVDSVLAEDSVHAYNTDMANTFEYVDYPDIPTGFYGYQGRYRQLVAEHNIDKPNSGIFISGNFVSGDSNSVFIDYNNGRVIVPYSSGQYLTITANSSVKEVNVYVTEDDEEKLLVQNDFIEKDALTSTLTTTNLFNKEDLRDDKVFMLPAIFIKAERSENKPFTFGGEVDTQISIRAVVLGFNNIIVDGILSAFRDKAQTCVKMVDYSDYPFGRSHTLKEYPYEYASLVQNGKMFIEEVVATKMTNSLTLEKLQKNIVMGFLDFDLSINRYPNS